MWFDWSWCRWFFRRRWSRQGFEQSLVDRLCTCGPTGIKGTPGKRRLGGMPFVMRERTGRLFIVHILWGSKAGGNKVKSPTLVFEQLAFSFWSKPEHT